MSPQERQNRIQLALIVWGGFVRCPTTGRILEYLKGDDKVMCNCGKSNPEVPAERTEQTGTHVVRFLSSVSAAQYVDEKGDKA